MDWLQANWFGCVTVSVCVATVVIIRLTRRQTDADLNAACVILSRCRRRAEQADQAASDALDSEVRSVAAELACRKCLLAHGPLTTKEG